MKGADEPARLCAGSTGADLARAGAASAGDRRPAELLHVALGEAWSAAQATGVYPWSTRGLTVEQVGFVHCSADDRQLRGVIDNFYSDVDDLVVLVIDVARLIAAGRQVRFEPGDPANPNAELFPHLYGGTLPLEAVSDVRAAPR